MAEFNGSAPAPGETIPPPTRRSDYLTAEQVGVLLHRESKTVRNWIARFHLGRREGVYKMPGGRFLFLWPVFEKEFVQRQGDDGEE